MMENCRIATAIIKFAPRHQQYNSSSSPTILSLPLPAGLLGCEHRERFQPRILMATSKKYTCCNQIHFKKNHFFWFRVISNDLKSSFSISLWSSDGWTSQTQFTCPSQAKIDKKASPKPLSHEFGCSGSKSMNLRQSLPWSKVKSPVRFI